MFTLLPNVSALGTRSIIEAMLEAANWAPTHGRTEPWRFVVLGRQAQEDMIDLTLKVCRRMRGPTHSTYSLYSELRLPLFSIFLALRCFL